MWHHPAARLLSHVTPTAACLAVPPLTLAVVTPSEPTSRTSVAAVSSAVAAGAAAALMVNAAPASAGIALGCACASAQYSQRDAIKQAAQHFGPQMLRSIRIANAKPLRNGQSTAAQVPFEQAALALTAAVRASMLPRCDVPAVQSLGPALARASAMGQRAEAACSKPLRLLATAVRRRPAQRRSSASSAITPCRSS